MSDVEHIQRHHVNNLISKILQRKSDGDDEKHKLKINGATLSTFSFI